MLVALWYELGKIIYKTKYLINIIFLILIKVLKDRHIKICRIIISMLEVFAL